MHTRPKHARSVESQQHQSTSFGFASGTKTQNHDPMPPEWMNRITSQEEEPLWAHGWIPLEPQDARTAHHPVQGHGCWAGLPVIPLHQHTGWAFTLDATPSTYDTRSQMWVYGLCAHTMALGQLKRLGTLTGVPQGSQTKIRAICWPA